MNFEIFFFVGLQLFVQKLTMEKLQPGKTKRNVNKLGNVIIKNWKILEEKIEK